ncbi:DEAD box helicase, putative [Plasmodium ovale wallikeri]|uniref:ATP-dependent RNA helicase n=2 Tax=Plasmodium ovale TaxID=36330 RepID=A0A1A8ZST1_PLAOA|nr:DEAD box helicase, putative [Plasmodium ovale wallikeri]SBT47543.1 DEAD box helicase, putative [Plasmodium ovale wallikeri]SBT82239.1 ATP-dependent RNA helicase DBP6, putative [Plasmodium ovale]
MLISDVIKRKHCYKIFAKNYAPLEVNFKRPFASSISSNYFHLRRSTKEINERVRKDKLPYCALKSITYISGKRNNERSLFFENTNRRGRSSKDRVTEHVKNNSERTYSTENNHIEESNNLKRQSEKEIDHEKYSASTFSDIPTNCNKKEDGEEVKIEDAEEIDKDAKRSLLEVFKYKNFTDVQKIIYENVIKERKKNDLLVQAKTGTGKTISYLLLVIDDIVKNKILSVHTLIIVPTRELANQIFSEAKLLLTFKNNINVLTLIGGVKRREDQINIRRVKPDIIICTVGRLLDHFECTYLFNTLFENLKMLIIDEADQLLSFGYQNDINRILSYLPQKRRNILLSATLCHNIDNIRKQMCKSDYIFLNCVKDTSKHTNEQLKQYVLFHKAIDTTVILYNLLLEHMRLNQFTYKILVFFPTARATSFYANLFKNQLKISVYEIHRKKEATHRQITSNRFSLESVGILFTSDISARGINYPDVTLIVQVNCAISREQYIHRVGRTARSNKEGIGIILLNEADELFYEQIKDLNIEKLNANDYIFKNTNVSNYLNSWMSNTQLLYLAYSYYSSLLRFYKTKYTTLKLTDDEIIDVVNNTLLSTGLVEQPHISSKLAVTLNMQNNARLKIRRDIDDLLL